MKHSKKQTLKHNLLAAAVTTALGTAAIPPSNAANLTFSIEGWFTLLNPPGTAAVANGDASGQAYYGWRTSITGTMTLDTDTGAGAGIIAPFSFFGSGNATATSITLQAIGDGAGGAGPLVLGNLGFNWGGTNGIPVSIVMDATGLFNALGAGLSVGQSVASPLADPADLTCTSDVACSDAATEGQLFGAKLSYTLPLGPSPVVTNTFNTTDIGTITIGTNPSGTLPLSDDGIGGSPMKAGPFPLFNANFDITRMVLTDDGSGPVFTAPADVDDTATGIGETPDLGYEVSIGTVTDEAPPTATVEYSIDGKDILDPTKVWTADNGTDNVINVDLLQTITSLVVDWRATSGGTTSFSTQNVTVTIEDTLPPSIVEPLPLDVVENVESLPLTKDVCFGSATFEDKIEPNLLVEYAINAEANWQAADPADNCADTFGQGENTVFWRATDVAGNVSVSYQQTVTLNLPEGIISKTCEINLDEAGYREVDGQFIMFNPSGALTGEVDDTVTGEIDTTLICDNEQCTDVGAALVTDQPFFGFKWTAEPIRLFPEGTWTFETCLDDGSSGICNEPDPGDTTISMTVGPGQLGAHMLFDWSVNKAIDVVVVWDVDCNRYMLTTTDPDGDGILGTPMVDGPFRGFNATFNISTIDGEVPIADGGSLISVPVYQNPVEGGGSPIPLGDDFIERDDLPADSDARRSCVGGCFEFETDGVLEGSDDKGDFKYVVVAIPLSEATPFWSRYRKFDEATGTWGPFVINARNDVKTAAVDPDTGYCPEPGKGSYSRAETGAMAEKLNGGDECLELTIEDNGPNDSNPAEGIVGDPGGVAELPAPKLKEAETSDDGSFAGTGSIGGSGGCTLSAAPVGAQQRTEWWLLGGMLGWLGLKLRRVRKQAQ